MAMTAFLVRGIRLDLIVIVIIMCVCVVVVVFLAVFLSEGICAYIVCICNGLAHGKFTQSCSSPSVGLTLCHVPIICQYCQCQSNWVMYTSTGEVQILNHMAQMKKQGRSGSQDESAGDRGAKPSSTKVCE